ncbi:MAG TPA: ABC transporter ATP-binding protein [Anaerolineae bacterium]|nr:ABC transporter ATP-binding protein [Anaerolineae bacterium]
MSDIAIRADQLGKRYRIGRAQQRHDTLRDALVAGVRGPLDRLRRPKPEEARPEEPAGSIWALKDISFEVRRGEVLGVIGRNGAGKSTLLKILSRITEPTQGRAEIHGRVGSLLEVGTGFHPELTGRENIYLNGAILGMHRAEIDRHFDEIVAFAEIEKFLETPVKRYSSGMYVRLAFAVAAHLEPEILLVDEVLAVGDAAFQKKCLGKMGEVAREGRTVLFVSHNMGAVLALCDKAVTIEAGRKVTEGASRAVIDTYLSSMLATGLTHSIAPARPDGMEAWVESATLECDGQISTTLPLGGTLAITVRFRSTIPTQMPSVGILVSSVGGQAVLNSNNIYLPSRALPSPVTEGVVRCSLGQVPLMANRYYVSLWLGIDASAKHQFLDAALTFEVVERDAWGTGRLPTSRISDLWWPTEFAYNSAQV